MIEVATARANVYGLLADVFREEPSEALLSKLGGPEFTGALHALDLSLDEVFESTSRAQLAEDLALEFTWLFIGPGSHISPHESMHREARFGEQKSLWSTQTVEVKKFMAAAGLKTDDSFSGMPDHFSAEFEFMQRLLLKEAEAWANEDRELGANIVAIEKRFYEEHLSQWVANFCDRVIDATRHPFYRQFSEVTKGFLDYEGSSLPVYLADSGNGESLPN
jgi:TorA maturation chaperone TorD